MTLFAAFVNRFANLCIGEATRVSTLRKRLKRAARNGKQIKEIIGDMELEIENLKARSAAPVRVWSLAGNRWLIRDFVVRRSMSDGVPNSTRSAVPSAAR
jgi:hypothetical protein